MTLGNIEGKSLWICDNIPYHTIPYHDAYGLKPFFFPSLDTILTALLLGLFYNSF
jgi:hypothetical protein